MFPDALSTKKKAFSGFLDSPGERKRLFFEQKCAKMINKRTLFGFNLSIFIDGLVKLLVKEVQRVNVNSKEK
jgi:hypothetical protein